MSTKVRSSLVAFVAFIGAALPAFTASSDLDRDVWEALDRAGFTGRVQSTLEARLGRPVDPQLADLGRLLWFDKAGGLHSDNTCGGCHSPGNGFGDSQSIAIGIQNNHLVGPSGFTTMRFENCARRRPRLLDAESATFLRRPDSDAGAAP